MVSQLIIQRVRYWYWKRFYGPVYDPQVRRRSFRSMAYRPYDGL